MLALLADIVAIDSGSYDKAGIDAVGAVIQRFLISHGVAVAVLPQQKHGDCLRAHVPAGIGEGVAARNILLLGHRDTVYPEGEVARRPFRIADGIATGPGVADMKAGLVMNCFVLAAFARFGGAPCPLVGLFTGDEEIGSPEGRPVIEAEAREARAVFNSEPGRLSGNVVSGRKGGVFSVIRIGGKAAHAGGNFADGVSAIEELARKIQAIHALTDLARGVTLNVGLVRGGQSVNTVAPSAEAEIDLRYVEPADRDEVVAQLAAIAARSYVPGTRAEFAIKGEFLPLRETEASQRLLEVYRRATAAGGFEVTGEFSGGCADSGFTAQLGAPTICAVGPIGGKAHSPEEFLRIGSLVPRAQTLVRTILDLPPAEP